MPLQHKYRRQRPTENGQRLDLHVQRRADAGEGIDERGDQHPVPQIPDGVCPDGVDQLALLLSVQRRRSAGFHHVLRPAQVGAGFCGTIS